MMRRFAPAHAASRALAAVLSFVALSLTGASHRTPNFIVTASTDALAKLVGQNAEDQRRHLAVRWTGAELPTWEQPCLIHARVAPGLRASGETSYVFQHGVPRDCAMQVQGSLDQVLDSVLPHEMLHMIFAFFFGRPLPRGMEEGACVYVEHQNSKQQLGATLSGTKRYESSERLDHFFVVNDVYPQNVLRFYSEAHLMVTFLIERSGERKFVEYLQDGLDSGQWQTATRRHYGYPTLGELQFAWLEWASARENAERLADSLPSSETPSADSQHGRGDTAPARTTVRVSVTESWPDNGMAK